MDINLTTKDIKEILNQIMKSPQVKKPKKLTDKEWEEGKKFVTKSGIKVRSKIEKIIADFYHSLGIKFEYEKKIRFPKMKNLKEYYTVYCDFYLPDYGVFHEHFGLEDKDYLDKKEIKKNAFKRFKMKFIYTEEEDENNIEEAIINKLKDIGFEIN
jgi:hypothetical protein